MSYTNALNLGSKQQEMIRLLEFHTHEIQFMEKYLTEVLNKNTAQDARKAGEHFQNLLIIHRNQVDELTKRIENNHHLASQEAKEHYGKIDVRLVQDNEAILDEVKSIDRVFLELRNEFRIYLMKWM
jgi:hypothetical protein